MLDNVIGFGAACPSFLDDPAWSDAKPVFIGNDRRLAQQRQQRRPGRNGSLFSKMSRLNSSHFAGRRRRRQQQEKNITTYNLARMNMLLHGVKDTEFEIYHGDTLTNDWDSRAD